MLNELIVKGVNECELKKSRKKRRKAERQERKKCGRKCFLPAYRVGVIRKKTPSLYSTLLPGVTAPM